MTHILLRYILSLNFCEKNKLLRIWINGIKLYHIKKWVSFLETSRKLPWCVATPYWDEWSSNNFCFIWLSEGRASWYILIIKANRMHYFSTLYGKELYMFQTGLLSIIRSLNTVFTAICICHTGYVDRLLARSEWTVNMVCFLKALLAYYVNIRIF
jgi:hypothetical protein